LLLKLSLLTYAPQWLDSNPESSTRNEVVFLLVKLAAAQGNKMPQWMLIRGVKITSKGPISVGNFSYIYQGHYEGGFVAVKCLAIDPNASLGEIQHMYKVSAKNPCQLRVSLLEYMYTAISSGSFCVAPTETYQRASFSRHFGAFFEPRT
jgi:hypothetical protein